MSKSSRKQTGGGRFDPQEGGIYFLACDETRGANAEDHAENFLVAMNEIRTEKDLEFVKRLIEKGRNVFIDSGVFYLVQQHAKNHDMELYDVFGLPAEQIDGYTANYENYMRVIHDLEAGVWGYIEIDLGGPEGKTANREIMEAQGLRPVPVYHPLTDGWDYFDFLCENYDRLCVGNVVYSSRKVRRKILSTIWERHQKYPDVWIHLLGLTPNEWLYAYPCNSADSSSWLSAIKWHGYMERSMGKPIGKLPLNYRYRLGEDSGGDDHPAGSHKASRMAAYGSHMLIRNWRHYFDEVESLGFQRFPENRRPDSVQNQ